jgi:hypothetical protein
MQNARDRRANEQMFTMKTGVVDQPPVVNLVQSVD